MKRHWGPSCKTGTVSFTSQLKHAALIPSSKTLTNVPLSTALTAGCDSGPGAGPWIRGVRARTSEG